MRGLSLSLFRYRYILELLAAALQLLLQPVAWYTLFLRSRWLLVLTIATLPSAYTYPWEWSLRIWFCTHGAVHWKRRGRMVEWEVVEWWDNRSIIERKDLRFLWLLRSAVRCPCVFGTQVWVWRHHRPIGNHALLCPQIKSRFARHQMGNVAIRDSDEVSLHPVHVGTCWSSAQWRPSPRWCHYHALVPRYSRLPGTSRACTAWQPPIYALTPTKDPVIAKRSWSKEEGPLQWSAFSIYFSARRRWDTGRARRNDIDSILKDLAKRTRHAVARVKKTFPTCGSACP